MTTALPPLSELLKAANVLSGQTKPDNVSTKRLASTKPNLADILGQRLDSISRSLSEWDLLDTSREPWHKLEEEALKRYTAQYSVTILSSFAQYEYIEAEKRIAALSAASTSRAAHQSAAPLFGMRDIKVIQTLSSLVARWGIASLLDQGILPSEMQERTSSLKVIDLDESQRKQGLRDMARTAVEMLVHGGQQQKGEIQSVVLPHLFLPTLGALLQLQHEDGITDVTVSALLSSVNPSTAMAALLTLLSVKQTHKFDVRPEWLNPVASSLLSKQMTRPGGILGILNVMLGRSEQDVQFNQLAQIARLITTPPKDVDADLYLSDILPRILGILRPPTTGHAPPPSFIRALCFCISSLISTAPDALRRSFLPAVSLQQRDIEAQIDLMSVIIGNIDPSPTNYSFLLSPLITRLYSMHFYISETRGDPVLKEAVASLIKTWARSQSNDELIAGLSRVIEDAPLCRWHRSDTGGVCVVDAAEIEEELQLDTQIKPNPDLVVHWLREHDRPQVTASLLVHWLDQVNVLRAEPTQEGNLQLQKKIILRLQLILKIIEECGSDIVKQAQQTLKFVDISLEQQPTEIRTQYSDRTGAHLGDKTALSLSDLKIVDEQNSSLEDEDEDDPEFPELLGIHPSEQLQVTGLTLLLAILEGNEDLSPGTSPALRSIDRKLSTLVDSANPTTSRLAEDARFILSLREAATSCSKTRVRDDTTLSASRDTYQEALKLLQDPILPVRAQGLAMLRTLVDGKDSLLSTDVALVPAILDIFVHAVQEEDSFIYLSAVQGLSGMVDSFGKDIAKRLALLYTGTDSTFMADGEKGRKELDKRLRVGEAIIQVIQRAEKALPVYADILVPPMLQVVRSASLPVALRASALTILATCADSAPLALLAYQDAIVDGMLDLLSVEGRNTVSTAKDETPDPLEVAATHPSLRRAAILLVGSLLRASPETFHIRTLARMKAVLGYLKQIDGDALVRHNASEVLEDAMEVSL